MRMEYRLIFSFWQDLFHESSFRLLSFLFGEWRKRLGFSLTNVLSLHTHIHVTCLSLTRMRKGVPGGRNFTLSFLSTGISFAVSSFLTLLLHQRKKREKRCMESMPMPFLLFCSAYYPNTQCDYFIWFPQHGYKFEEAWTTGTIKSERSSDMSIVCHYLRWSLIKDIQSHPVLSLPQDFQLHLMLLLLMLLNHWLDCRSQTDGQLTTSRQV